MLETISKGYYMSDKLVRDMLIRKNKGRQILNEWISEFNKIVPIDIKPNDFLSIEETDSLRDAFAEKILKGKDVFKVNYPRQLAEKLYPDMKKLGARIGPLEVVMFSSVDKFIGALNVHANYVLNNAESVWRFVESDFVLLERNLDSGICFEVNFYSLKGEYVKEGVFEISLWGRFQEFWELLKQNADVKA